MKRLLTASTLALVLAMPSAAFAWVPPDDDDRPETEAPPGVADPAPVLAPPPGVYYVTDTYVADVVTTSGPLTTYATTTVHESTGTWARVLESVGTGVASAFDGLAFNGRLTLTDGRMVAGTYYENLVVTAGGFVPVSVVFFQDDSELATVALSAPTPRPAATPSPKPSSVAAPTSAPASTFCPAARPVPCQATPPLPLRTARPGVALTAAGAPLARVEVLRGRAITLWLRAFADDREIPIRAWSLASGDPGEAAATSGAGSTPFRTFWTRLAPPGSAYELVFRVEIDTPETGARSLAAPIAIVVRSPALEE